MYWTGSDSTYIYFVGIQFDRAHDSRFWIPWLPSFFVFFSFFFGGGRREVLSDLFLSLTAAPPPSPNAMRGQWCHQNAKCTSRLYYFVSNKSKGKERKKEKKETSRNDYDERIIHCRSTTTTTTRCCRCCHRRHLLRWWWWCHRCHICGCIPCTKSHPSSQSSSF